MAGQDLGPFNDPRIVLRLVDDGMVLFAGIDGEGTIAWMSGSAHQVLGRPPEQLTGTSAFELIHPADHDVVISSLAESARNAEERILAVLRIRHVDGTWLTFEFGGIDLRDDDGGGTFLVWGRSYESTQRLKAFLTSLLTASDLGHLLGQVITWADALMPFSASTVLARHDTEASYHGIATSPTLPAALGREFDVSETLWAQWRSLLTVSRVIEIPITDLPAPIAADAGAHGVAVAWVVGVAHRAGGEPVGLIITWRLRHGAASATHLRHLGEAAELAQLAFDWARTQSALVTAATTDALTGVANRSQLLSAVAAHRSSSGALLFCDLTHFKTLNDEHGHSVGDQVLRIVARRMQATTELDELFVRLGGDEFAVWCPSACTDEAAGVVADRIMCAFDEPVHVDGIDHHISCSIGIACLSPSGPDVLDLEDLLTRADIALYQAKAIGPGEWVLVPH